MQLNYNKTTTKFNTNEKQFYIKKNKENKTTNHNNSNKQITGEK